MADRAFSLNILTPEKPVYTGDAVAISVPGWEGRLGVLAGHAPLISYLKSGAIEVTPVSGKKISYSARGNGFLEVFNNKVVLLMDAVD